MTPGERFLPRGFQTVYKTNGRKNPEALDAAIAEVTGGSPGKPALAPVETAVEMLRLAYENLEFDSDEEDERRAHIAILEHLSRAAYVKDSGKVWLITNAEDRKVSRVRPDGRYQDSPDTKQQRDMASKLGRDLPILILLRQGGAEERGWRGLPFWWPVVVTSFSAVTSVFADEVPADAGAVTA